MPVIRIFMDAKMNWFAQAVSAARRLQTRCFAGKLNPDKDPGRPDCLTRAPAELRAAEASNNIAEAPSSESARRNPSRLVVPPGSYLFFLWVFVQAQWWWQTLMAHALKVYPDNYVAHQNLARYLRQDRQGGIGARTLAKSEGTGP